MKSPAISMQTHLFMVSWFHIIFGGLLVSLSLTGLWLGPERGGVNLPTTLFFVMIGLPLFLGGIGLLRRWPRIRNLMLIMGVMNLLNFPIGTVLGFYTLWVLWSPEAKQLLPRD